MRSCVQPKKQTEVGPIMFRHDFDSSYLEWCFTLPSIEEGGWETWTVDILEWGSFVLDRSALCVVAPNYDHLYSLWTTNIKRPMVLVGPSRGSFLAIDFSVKYLEIIYMLILIDASVPAHGKPEAVIVIGGDIGSLCCAGLNCRHDHDVLQLEYRNVARGAIHCFDIEGYKVDYGTSFLCGFHSRRLEETQLAHVLDALIESIPCANYDLWMVYVPEGEFLSIIRPTTFFKDLEKYARADSVKEWRKLFDTILPMLAAVMVMPSLTIRANFCALSTIAARYAPSFLEFFAPMGPRGTRGVDKLLRYFSKIIDALEIKDPVIHNWLDILAFLLLWVSTNGIFSVDMVCIFSECYTPDCTLKCLFHGSAAMYASVVAPAGVYLLRRVPLRLYTMSIVYDGSPVNRCIDWNTEGNLLCVDVLIVAFTGDLARVVDNGLHRDPQYELLSIAKPQAASFVLASSTTLVPHNSVLSNLNARNLDLIYVTGFSELDLSLYLYLICVAENKCTQALWLLDKNFVHCFIENPTDFWFIRPINIALGGIVLKKGLCYGKLDSGIQAVVIPIPSLLFGHMPIRMVDGEKFILLNIWMAHFIVFAGRKFVFYDKFCHSVAVPVGLSFTPIFHASVKENLAPASLSFNYQEHLGMEKISGTINSVFDSNLEGKVLIEDGRNVMNATKLADPFGKMANYIWDPGKIAYI